MELDSTLLFMNQKFYFVYILFSLKDYKLYIGYTENLESRTKEHLKGKVRATKLRLPLTLISYEAFTDKQDAKAREKFLKSGFGRSQLKKALQNKLKQLNYKHLQSCRIHPRGATRFRKRRKIGEIKGLLVLQSCLSLIKYLFL